MNEDLKYERYMYAENLETLRDLLNRMEKLNLKFNQFCIGLAANERC